LTMLPFNIDIATVAGVIILFVMKTWVLNRYVWPRKDWQKWAVATVAGLAVSVALRILLRL
jgi:hypothetical protein